MKCDCDVFSTTQKAGSFLLLLLQLLLPVPVRKRISLKPRKSKLEDVSGVYTILLSQRDFLLCKLSKLWQLFPW
jgi:hypothetical protein